jgi:inosose dehydratase
MITRRSFTAGLAGAPALFGQMNQHYEPKLQGQIYVWMQHYAKQNQRAEEHIGEILTAFKAAGYKEVELTSSFFTPEFEKATYAALQKSGIECTVVYTGGSMHEETLARQTTATVVGMAQKLKLNLPLQAINFNPNPLLQGAEKTDAQLAVQAQAVNTLGWSLYRDGIALLLHQHDPEMKNNAREWRYMLKNTDRQQVRFCLDLHWAYRGGQDPLALLKECGRRVGSVHVRNSKNGTWTEQFGEGDVDYRPVAKQLRDIDFDGFLVVELAWDKDTKLTRSLEENLKLSRQYAEKVFDVKA